MPESGSSRIEPLRGGGSVLENTHASTRNEPDWETKQMKKNLADLPSAQSLDHAEKTNQRQIFYIFRFMICRADTS